MGVDLVTREVNNLSESGGFWVFRSRDMGAVGHTTETSIGHETREFRKEAACRPIGSLPVTVCRVRSLQV